MILTDSQGRQYRLAGITEAVTSREMVHVCTSIAKKLGAKKVDSKKLSGGGWKLWLHFPWGDDKGTEFLDDVSGLLQVLKNTLQHESTKPIVQTQTSEENTFQGDDILVRVGWSRPQRIITVECEPTVPQTGMKTR